MTETKIEFWFEFASTYCYPAAARVGEVARQYRAQILWRPFLLGPIFHGQGWNDSPFNLYPVKGRYMWRDLERICSDLQIPLRRPSQFPRNGLFAARIACVSEGTEWLPQFVRNAYAANFGDDQDIAEPKDLLNCLNGLVADPEAVLRTAREENAKTILRRNTERAVELGIFGAPTFVAGNELFWGNDRLEAALEWKRFRHEAGRQVL